MRLMAIVMLMLVGCLGLPAEGWAQIFGQRTLGNTLSRRSRPGELSGGERFVRENRARRDFVGRDIREIRRFVGAQQASVTGAARPASMDLRPTQQADVNRNVRRPSSRRAAVYPPKLEIGFNVPPPARLGTTLEARMAKIPRLRQVTPMRVTVHERTAILEGEVASPHDRLLAEQLARLEPGIDRVRNLLVVAPESAVEPLRPPAPR